MEPMEPGPADQRLARSRLAGPWIAAGLVTVVVALGATLLLVPGLVRLPWPGPTASAAATTAATAPSATASSEPSFNRPTPSPGPTFMSYVVRVGDTLSSVARAFSTTARSIAWWNRGTYPSLDPESEIYDPNRIEPGWTLVLIPGTVVDESAPPTPSPRPPGATPGASVITTLPPSGGLATVVSFGPRGTNQIALTFDMGGRLDPAVEIVTWLVNHDVHATFFPTGRSATTTSDGTTAMTIAAGRTDLFDFGNHSWDHPDFTTLTAAQMADQLTSTESAIKVSFGQTTVPWFRPPYGAWNDSVRSGVGAAGWSELVLWDIDTIDWKATADGGPTAADIVTRVLSRAQGGSIVLMHLGGWYTLDALPDILSGLQAKGLVPVTLTEMLGS